MNTPLLGDALIYSRDGIVGAWQPPGNPPQHLGLDNADNLERWEPWVRESIVDFEMFSRLGFVNSSSGSPNPNLGPVSVRHLEADTANLGQHVYLPLIEITRPDPAMLLNQQLRFVAGYADLRPDRASEILSQLGGGVAFLSSIAYLHPERTRWTLELLSAALRLASFVGMRLKHALACKRPHEFSAQIQPMILTPSHSSFPSGHAIEAFAAATVLWKLLYEVGNVGANPQYRDTMWGTQLMRLAARLAINRTVAGVHFPVDSAAGAVAGLTLGHYLVARCTYLTSYTAWRFDSTRFPVPSTSPSQPPPLDGDFYWNRLYDVANRVQTEAGLQNNFYAVKVPPPQAQQGQPIAAPPQNSDTVLTKLWKKARAEWT